MTYDVCRKLELPVSPIPIQIFTSNRSALVGRAFVVLVLNALIDLDFLVMRLLNRLLQVPQLLLNA
jgi:hypothetical protein